MSKEGEAKKKIIHFYCYICKEYELKTSPHYRRRNSDSPNGARSRKYVQKRQSEAFIIIDPVRSTPKRRKERAPKPKSKANRKAK